jgi:hypothetical protein
MVSEAVSGQLVDLPMVLMGAESGVGEQLVGMT